MSQPVGADSAWITDPTGVFVYLASLLGAAYWLSGLAPMRMIFDLAPAILWAYFLPMVSTTLGIIPSQSIAYD
ncbi:MAG: DUF819 domain-containing protein, partial [Gemmatimonadota bacterium]